MYGIVKILSKSSQSHDLQTYQDSDSLAVLLLHSMETYVENRLMNPKVIIQIKREEENTL